MSDNSIIINTMIKLGASYRYFFKPSYFIYRFGIVISILVLFLITECTPIPIPTSEPIGSNTSATPLPTTTSLAIVDPTPTIFTLTNATSTITPLTIPTAITYDHNPRALLVDADVYGGSAAVPRDKHVHLFRLYGDGLVIYAGDRTSISSGMDASVQVGFLSELEIQNLLAYLTQIGYFTLKEYYQPRPTPTDMQTAYISIYLNKVKTVSVYAPDSDSSPKIFTDAFNRIIRTHPSDTKTFVPTDGYLEATDAGSVSNTGAKDRIIEWSLSGIRLADAIDGVTISGNGYMQITALRADKPSDSLYREGDRVYQIRFIPNLPRAVHLSDWLGSVLNAPREFEGRTVDILGYYRGWDMLGEAHSNPPVSRSDWVIADEGGAMYVNGAVPKGLNPSSHDDIWNVIRLSATVVYVRLGTSYLEARRVEVLTSSSQLTITPTVAATTTPSATPSTVASGPLIPITSADAAIALVKSRYKEVDKIQKKGAGIIGAANDIQVIERTDGWDIIFWEGSGDCPAGCINNHYYYYSVKKDGRVQKVGEYARIFNNDKNSFEVTGTPSWGVPK